MYFSCILPPKSAQTGLSTPDMTSYAHALRKFSSIFSATGTKTNGPRNKKKVTSLRKRLRTEVESGP